MGLCVALLLLGGAWWRMCDGKAEATRAPQTVSGGTLTTSDSTNGALVRASPSPPRATREGHSTVARNGLFDSYSAVSPHWPHIRTMVTDFRTTWLQNASQKASEINWGARHFDYVMSGPLEVYKERNPAIKTLPYALNWTVMQPGPKASASLTSGFYSDMQRWYAVHPQFQLEDAFLHVSGQPKSADTRVQIKIWDSQRWVINPGDPGARAYQVDRVLRVVANTDGIFFDENASADLRGRIEKIPTLEYPNLDRYEQDAVSSLGSMSKAIAPKIVMINTAEYTKPFDQAMILAAGAVHLERMNNSMSGNMEMRWGWTEDLLAKGVMVEFVALNSWDEVPRLSPTFTAGNYGSVQERAKMWELASYYLIVPSRPDNFLLDLQNAWKVPFSQVWLKAQEVNIGHPVGARSVYQKGTDPTGHAYRVWRRDFDRAMVLVRPVIGWDKQRNDDSTSVIVPLPEESTWRPLLANGTLGEPVTSVVLRNPESAILVRGDAQ